MNFTEKQIEELRKALQIIDDVHYSISEDQGEDTQEFETVNAAWCILDNALKGIGI